MTDSSPTLSAEVAERSERDGYIEGIINQCTEFTQTLDKELKRAIAASENTGQTSEYRTNSLKAELAYNRSASEYNNDLLRASLKALNSGMLAKVLTEIRQFKSKLIVRERIKDVEGGLSPETRNFLARFFTLGLRLTDGDHGAYSGVQLLWLSGNYDPQSKADFRRGFKMHPEYNHLPDDFYWLKEESTGLINNLDKAAGALNRMYAAVLASGNVDEIKRIEIEFDRKLVHDRGWTRAASSSDENHMAFVAPEEDPTRAVASLEKAIHRYSTPREEGVEAPVLTFAQAQARIKLLEGQKGEMESQLQAARSEVGQTRTQLSADIGRVTGEKTDLSTRVEQLTAELAAANNALLAANTRASSAEAETDRVRTEAGTNRTAERAALVRQLKATTTPGKMYGVNVDGAALQKIIEQLET